MEDRGWRNVSARHSPSSILHPPSSIFHPRLQDSCTLTLLSTSPCLIASTTSSPERTWPKTVCLPSSQSVTTCVMKNCEPLVFGPALAMLSDPRWCLRYFPGVSSSANLYPGPPRPVPSG